MNKNILIVGYGVVGKNLHNEILELNPDIFDKFKIGYNTKRTGIKYDLAFICVDTPLTRDEPVDLDITEVRNAINENEADIYVIKSTCPLGTIEKLKHNLFDLFTSENDSIFAKGQNTVIILNLILLF